MEDSGTVTFCPIREDQELELMYLAPELQDTGIVTEKVTHWYTLCGIREVFQQYRKPLVDRTWPLQTVRNIYSIE